VAHGKFIGFELVGGRGKRHGLSKPAAGSCGTKRLQIVQSSQVGERRKAMRSQWSVTGTVFVAGLAALALTLAARAGGDKVAFPENYASGTLYGTVDRYDIKQYRELFATPAAVEAVRNDQPIPSGTVLTMVQYKARSTPRATRSRTRTAASSKAISSAMR
jgi:hypothetical protein